MVGLTKRNIMAQELLNVVTMCHVNKEILNKVNLSDIVEQFLERSEIRRGIFDSFNI